MNPPSNEESAESQTGMSEEEAFRRALGDAGFRAYLLSEWRTSRKRAHLFVAGSVALFGAITLYRGFVYGQWAPNMYLAGLIVVAHWMKSRADTTIAALQAMGDR